MEFWRAYIVEATGDTVSFVSERGCVREWVAWHLSRGALCGVVSRSCVVSAASDLSCPSVWRNVWQFLRDPFSGAVSWQRR